MVNPETNGTRVGGGGGGGSAEEEATSTDLSQTGGGGGGGELEPRPPPPATTNSGSNGCLLQKEGKNADSTKPSAIELRLQSSNAITNSPTKKELDLESSPLATTTTTTATTTMTTPGGGVAESSSAASANSRSFEKGKDHRSKKKKSLLSSAPAPPSRLIKLSPCCGETSATATSGTSPPPPPTSSTSCCCDPLRGYLGRRTPLERCLLASLAVCLAVLLLALAPMAVALIRVASDSAARAATPSQNGAFIQDLNGASICLTPQCVQTSSYLLAAMDPSADPCDDFFQFACGSWNRKHIIPEDRSSISTFEVLADQLQIILKGILEEDRDQLDNNATLMAKYFYQSCMDMAKIEEVSDRPLREVIARLGGWPVVNKNWSEEEAPPLERVLGTIKRNFTIGVLVEEWIGPDDKNSKSHIIQIDQMPLGLPSRDYFLHMESEKDLEAYHLYMTDVAVLLGANRTDAYEQLWTVVQFEQTLANITIPEEDRIDTGAIYTKLSLQELKEEVPQMDWDEYFDTVLAGVPYHHQDEQIVSYSMPYFRELGKVLQGTNKTVVHNYVIWRLVMDLMPHMPPQYEATRAEFRRVLLGVLTDRNRWNRCVEWTNKKLGMAVGALFIRDNFNHESKATALEMIHDIREAFNELLEENEWMDGETRLVAKDKADSMNERIGYPEYITNGTRLEEEYTNLTIGRGRFLENLFNILRFEAEKNVNKLRKPVDKDKWATEPAVVNAFYNPNKNDIVFPAGILQPLFYSQHFPKSLNYGGIGVVIGHEITHGFDDKGRQFDKEGNLKQWWNNQTIGHFRKAAACIVDQYSQYKLEEINLPINGRMTQGENIADNGGLKQAFRAYSKWVHEHGEEPLLPGLNMTHEQLFFLNYAQIWCGSMRPEDALTKIRSSVHSPGPIRVLGPLSNSWDFARAYRCGVGSRMNPVEKCSVW